MGSFVPSSSPSAMPSVSPFLQAQRGQPIKITEVYVSELGFEPSLVGLGPENLLGFDLFLRPNGRRWPVLFSAPTD